MHQDTDHGACKVCGQAVDLSAAHWLHQDVCPRRDDPNGVCTCNEVAHSECCPECHPGSSAEVEP